MIINQHRFFLESCIQDAVTHALDMFPLESCGAIIDDEYAVFENTAQDPENSFLINDAMFDRAYADGRVQAVIHSHNNVPYASKADQEQQLAMGVPFGIINLVNKSAVHFVMWGDSLPVEPLEKRSFFYGVWDCFSLVRDYMRINHNIAFKNISREHGFWLRGESMFEVFMDRFDVDPVPLNRIRPNDVLLYNLNGTKHLNHCGVMQENGLILHHFENHISRAVPVSFSQQFLRSAVRVKGVS